MPRAFDAEARLRVIQKVRLGGNLTVCDVLVGDLLVGDLLVGDLLVGDLQRRGLGQRLAFRNDRRKVN